MAASFGARHARGLMRAEVRFGERLTRSRELLRSALTSGPGILWVGVFLLAPLIAVGAIAFLTRGPYGEIGPPVTLQNFRRLLGFRDSPHVASQEELNCLNCLPFAEVEPNDRPVLAGVDVFAGDRQATVEIVENLGGGRDRRTRIRARAPLLDRDRRRQAFDEIDVRFFHLVEELPGVSREALHVTALPFGIEGIEGKRRLSRAAQARDNDQFFPRNRDVEIL